VSFQPPYIAQTRPLNTTCCGHQEKNRFAQKNLNRLKSGEFYQKKPWSAKITHSGWSLLANPLEGARSVGAVNWCLIYGAQRQPGLLLPPKATTDHRRRHRMVIAGQSPGDAMGVVRLPE
jgi:hypothetical protein